MSGSSCNKEGLVELAKSDLDMRKEVAIRKVAQTDQNCYIEQYCISMLKEGECLKFAFQTQPWIDSRLTQSLSWIKNQKT